MQQIPMTANCLNVKKVMMIQKKLKKIQLKLIPFT